MFRSECSTGGGRRYASSDLPVRLANQQRVELPLLDGHGNALVALTAQASVALPAQTLTLAWPTTLSAPRLALFARGGTRQLLPLDPTLANGQLSVAIPSYDTHATSVLLNEAAPLVSVELDDVPRGEAGLATVRPGQRFKLHATLFNTSGKTLPRGEISLTLPIGWFQDEVRATVGTVKPGRSRSVSFTVQAPAHSSGLALRPLLARWQAGDQHSTPATEMIWWQP